MIEYVAVFVAVTSAVGAIIGAVATGRANRRTVAAERKLPPYDVLAARVSDFDTTLLEAAETNRESRRKIDSLEDRIGSLEECYEKMEHILEMQREWIQEAVALAEITGAIAKLATPPESVDLHSESMQQHREEARRRHGPRE